MNDDANTSSTAFPTPLSHLQHLLILGLKTGQREMKTGRARPTTRRRRGARLARERETERENDGVFGRARQLGLPAMFAQGGLQLRVSSGRENERDRERKRCGALPGVTLRGAPPDARRKRDTNIEKERFID